MKAFTVFFDSQDQWKLISLFLMALNTPASFKMGNSGFLQRRHYAVLTFHDPADGFKAYESLSLIRETGLSADAYKSSSNTE